MPTIKRTNDEWRALLAEQRASGQQQKDWCAANGINLYTLRDRASRLRKVDKETTEHTKQHNSVSVDWMEIKTESLVEADHLPTLETKPDGHLLTASKEVSYAIEPGAAETVPGKNAADISITCWKWTVTVKTGFEAGLLIDVLRAVNQVCC